MKNKTVLFFTPYYRQSRGNSTTARRIVNGLERQGMTVKVFAYEEDHMDLNLKTYLERADIYHILHIKRFAEWLQKHPHIILTKPYILTSGGTDVNEDLKNQEAIKLMKSVADRSCAITVFSIDGRDKIVSAYPSLLDRVFVIPQSVWLPENKGMKPVLNYYGYPKLLLPAGLRPVKDVLFLVDELVRIRGKWPELSFSIIGAPLEETVTQQVKEIEAKYDWFHYIEDVALEQMTDVYAHFDIIINTSLSEGQPTSILEAMSLGKPVMARRIPGNESIIMHRETGLLFTDESEFHQLLDELLRNQKWCEQLCQEAKDSISTHHSVGREINQLLEVYEHCLHLDK